MRILGIDPGLTATGYGLIDASEGKLKMIEAGIIRTAPGQKIQNRVDKVYDVLKNIVAEYDPNVLVLEKLYSHYKHPTTAILMGHIRGVVCLLCGEKKIPLVNYPSTRIKKAITGHGHASKRQIQGMVQNFLSLKEIPEPNDVADALAAALSHAFMEKNNDFEHTR